VIRDPNPDSENRSGLQLLGLAKLVQEQRRVNSEKEKNQKIFKKVTLTVKKNSEL
jgi:hypothetical protein